MRAHLQFATENDEVDDLGGLRTACRGPAARFRESGANGSRLRLGSNPPGLDALIWAAIRLGWCLKKGAANEGDRMRGIGAKDRPLVRKLATTATQKR